jgi:ParB-like chromosome segregation protein Spo0J
MSKLEITEIAINELIPYVNNARTHSDEQVAQIAASIREFGWTNPILVDGDKGIIAGHGRLAAARKLKMEAIPAIELHGLSEAQKKALILADNKLALNSGWDDKLLSIELADLTEMNFDISVIGFNNDELKELFLDEELESIEDETYTKKVEAPTYEPSNEKPDIKSLFDDSKTFDLIEKIKNSALPREEKDFLMLAAGRHTVINFQLVADYYAHASTECQELMEANALVIIDFNKAIENGYAVMSEKISDQYSKDYPDEE